MDTDLVGALRQRGVPVTTPIEENLIGSTDEQQFEYATKHRCVLYTFNISDFFARCTLDGWRWPGTIPA